MSKEIIINSTVFEKRVAFLEGGRVTRVMVERESERGIVGNIYKGKIVRVLPGMQACFVDIGLDRAAFLYVDDIVTDARDYDVEENINKPDIVDVMEASEEKPVKDVSINDLIREGQEISVQVLKDTLGSKGARVTTHISLAGRFLVYMPTVEHVGVSRKIEDEKERERLRECIDSLQSKHGGFIVRTLAEGIGKKAIKADMLFLEKLWKNIKATALKAPVGKLIYQDLDLALKTVRDYLSHDIDKLIVDDRSEHRKILKFIETFSPQLKQSVIIYTGDEPVFDAYSVEPSISRAFSRRVWLKSGGYIVIDQTEALVAIDVNSGRYVGKMNLEDTILKINLEAVAEIVDQLQIRNIGGIIIIDFIDMEKEHNREKVFNALKDSLKNDRAKTNILKISELGLIQMTRQRVSGSLRELMGATCPYCDGRGYVKSIDTVSYDILREIKRETIDMTDGEDIQVIVNPEIARYMYEKMHAVLEKYEKKSRVKIVIESNVDFHIEQFEVFQKTDGVSNK